MLNYFCREKIAVPTGLPPRGLGSRRVYTLGDVVALRLVRRLSCAGVSIMRLPKAMLRLRAIHPEIMLTSLLGSPVVTDGRDIYIRDGDSLELAPVRDEVARKVSVLRRVATSWAKRAA